MNEATSTAREQHDGEPRLMRPGIPLTMRVASAYVSEAWHLLGIPDEARVAVIGVVERAIVDAVGAEWKYSRKFEAALGILERQVESFCTWADDPDFYERVYGQPVVTARSVGMILERFSADLPGKLVQRARVALEKADMGRIS
jgi:hypothetical protein